MNAAARNDSRNLQALPLWPVSLVALVRLVHLVYLVGLVQLDKRDKLNKPDAPDRPDKPATQPLEEYFFSSFEEESLHPSLHSSDGSSNASLLG